MGAAAAADGADCLVIDAESEYEGRYAQARTYVTRLRAAVGADFPIGLAGFPYVHYHPAYPYSVFLGPGGAEFNLPQVYWKAIGDSVDRALATTYTYNRVYGRPISPDRPALRQPAGPRGAPLPPGGEGERLRRHLVVVVAARLGERLPLGDQAPRRPRPRLPPEPRLPDAGEGSRGRPRRLGPGAPGGGRVLRRRGDRQLRPAHLARRARVPGDRRPGSDRGARRRLVEGAGRRPRPGGGEVGGPRAAPAPPARWPTRRAPRAFRRARTSSAERSPSPSALL